MRSPALVFSLILAAMAGFMSHYTMVHPPAFEFLSRLAYGARGAAWLAILFLASWGIGRRVWIWGELSDSAPSARLAMTTGAGLGIIGLFLLAAGYAGRLTPPIVALFLAIPLWEAWRNRDQLRVEIGILADDLQPSLWWVVGLPWLGTSLLLAICPILYGDEVTYHGFFVRHFAETGTIPWQMEGTRHIWFPFLPHVLAATGWMFWVPEAIRFTQLGCGLLLLGLLRGWAQEWEVSGGFTLAIFLASPLIAISMGIGNVTIAQTFFQTAFLYALSHLAGRPQNRGACLAGLFLGFLIWVKQISIVALFFLTVLVILGRPLPRRFPALVLLVALLIGGGFFLKNWVVAGDPLHPYGWPTFASAGWNPFLYRNELAVCGRLPIATFGETLNQVFQIMIGREKIEWLGESLGKSLFALVPLLFLVPWSALRGPGFWLPVAFVLFYGILWLFGPLAFSVLIPVVPVYILVLGLGFRKLCEGGATLRLALTGALALFMAMQFPTDALHLAMPFGLGRQSQVECLVTAWGNTYRAFTALDQVLPPGTRVLSLFAPQRFFTRCTLLPAHDIGGSFAMSTPAMLEVLKKSALRHPEIFPPGNPLTVIATREEALKALQERDIRYVFVSEEEVTDQTRLSILPMLQADLEVVFRFGKVTLYRLRS